MKKIIVLVIALLLMLPLYGCNHSTTVKKQIPMPQGIATEGKATKVQLGNKNLEVYNLKLLQNASNGKDNNIKGAFVSLKPFDEQPKDSMDYYINILNKYFNGTLSYQLPLGNLKGYITTTMFNKNNVLYIVPMDKDNTVKYIAIFIIKNNVLQAYLFTDQKGSFESIMPSIKNFLKKIGG